MRRFLGSGAGRRAARNLTVPSGSSYADGDAGADAFVAAIASELDGDAGITLWDGWLAHDSDTYRTIDTGVDALISINSGINAVQATAGSQPSIDSNGPNGRGRLVMASDYLEATGFTTASTERWGLLTVAKRDSGNGSFCGLSDIGASFASITLSTFSTDHRAVLHYDDGSTGTTDTIVLGTADTSAHITEGFFSSPHAGYRDGNETTSAETAGASVAMDVGAGAVCIGAHRAFFVTSKMTGDWYFGIVMKLAGTSVPTSMAAVRAIIEDYYQL